MEYHKLKIISKQNGKDNVREDDKLKIEFERYRQCYGEALSAIIKNIQHNQKDSEKKLKQSAMYSGMSEGYIAPLEESNIFAFVGNRGSGKTTAVNEFCRLLHEYHGNKEKWSSEIGYMAEEMDSYRFHMLPPIDASILEAKEDLMEVILASMNQIFQINVQDSRKQAAKSFLIQEIVSKFDEVYRDYICVGNHKEQKILGEPVLVKLNHTSNSLKTKAEFERLIEKFLVLLDDGKESDHSFLVVTIDDLDLNLENGYEMLEQLHKYLSNRRTIILVAIKYEQMKLICEKRIVDSFIPEFGGVHKDIYDRFDRKAKGLSNDYLLKVLPPSNRIYMPEQFQLYKNEIVIDEENPEIPQLPVKEFLLTKIALKMNIYYDGRGKKKHFCLPDTVRELVAYNSFLNSLFSLEEITEMSAKDPEKAMRMYDQNHDRFNYDIEKRMALQILNDAQQELYYVIMNVDIERRARYTVNFLEERMRSRSRQIQRFEDTVDEYDYCYADLLEVLYSLGRVNYGDKALVHCLLASFTSEMVREYYSYRHNMDQDAKKRAGSRLRGFLGETFGGSWFNNAMPKVAFVQSKGVPMTVGYIPGAAILNQKITIILGSETEDEKLLINKLSDILPCMECLTLLFSNCRHESGKLKFPEWEFEIKAGDTVDDRSELIISNGAISADFDIFNFIGKEIASDDFLSFTEIQDRLSKAMQSCLEKHLESTRHKSAKEKKKLLTAFQNSARRKSIWFGGTTEDLPEDMANGKAVFPYFDLDMSYNIMKRVRTKLIESQQKEYEDIVEFFQITYGYIAQALYEEQYFYEKVVSMRKIPKFYEDFVGSSFIRAFGVICEDEGLSRKARIDTQLAKDILFQAIKGLGINRIPGIQQQEDPE